MLRTPIKTETYATNTLYELTHFGQRHRKPKKTHSKEKKWKKRQEDEEEKNTESH